MTQGAVLATDPRADVVSAQYERWVYPEPIEDLPEWLRSNWQWFDPAIAHDVLWPDRPYPANLQILVAGCGTSQAAVLAYANPGAHVVGIDVSAASLAHHEALKARYGLRNLELHRLPIEEVAQLGRDFDLIVSTGVLHHLDDPQAGMNALAACLRRDGVLALMLYARFGRTGVDILEGVFQDLGLGQEESALEVVRTALDVLPAQHPVQGYLANAWDTYFDAGLVDTFLHGRARAYTVEDCLGLVGESGLDFQGWFFHSPYEPGRLPGNAFLEAVRELPDATRWSVMERINTTNACHFFMACRPDRPADQYRIDSSTASMARSVPVFRHGCALDGELLVKPGWSTGLAPDALAIARYIDGQRTVDEIDSLVSSATSAHAAAAAVVRDLWEQDFVALRTAPR